MLANFKFARLWMTSYLNDIGISGHSTFWYCGLIEEPGNIGRLSGDSLNIGRLSEEALNVERLSGIMVDGGNQWLGRVKCRRGWLFEANWRWLAWVLEAIFWSWSWVIRRLSWQVVASLRRCSCLLFASWINWSWWLVFVSWRSWSWLVRRLLLCVVNCSIWSLFLMSLSWPSRIWSVFLVVRCRSLSLFAVDAKPNKPRARVVIARLTLENVAVNRHVLR